MVMMIMLMVEYLDSYSKEECQDCHPKSSSHPNNQYHFHLCIIITIPHHHNYPIVKHFLIDSRQIGPPGPIVHLFKADN